eukprot:3513804-Pleurochrysis_carterae.AAC.1
MCEHKRLAQDRDEAEHEARRGEGGEARLRHLRCSFGIHTRDRLASCLGRGREAAGKDARDERAVSSASQRLPLFRHGVWRLPAWSGVGCRHWIARKVPVACEGLDDTCVRWRACGAANGRAQLPGERCTGQRKLVPRAPLHVPLVCVGKRP